jgi:hypothetical protein
MIFDPDDYDCWDYVFLEGDDYVNCNRCCRECVWRCVEGKWLLFDEDTDDQHNCAAGVFND